MNPPNLSDIIMIGRLSRGCLKNGQEVFVFVEEKQNCLMVPFTRPFSSGPFDREI